MGYTWQLWVTSVANCMA